MGNQRSFGITARKSFAIVLLFFSSFLAFSDDFATWRFTEGDQIEWAAPDFNDSGWKTLELPASVSTKEMGGSFWLRAILPVGTSAIPGGAYLLLGKIDAAAEVYLNGSLIGFRGSMPPRYASNANNPSVFLLPSGLLKSDGETMLAVRFANPSSSIHLGRISVANAESARYQTNIIAFFNVQLYAILGVLCAFIGVYFLLLWTFRRNEYTNLWYALSSLAIAYYFSDMGSFGSIIDYGLRRALAKSCLTVSMSALIAFFVVYFKVKRPRWLAPTLITVPVAALIAFIASAHDFSKISLVFTIGLLYVQIAIVFIAFVTIRGVFRGDRESIPLLFGVALGVGFGTYDVVHKVTGVEPFAWLQGVGFFCLNLSLFVTLTLRSSRLSRELERYSADVAAKTAQLSSYVERIGGVADSVTVIAERIDSDADTAASSAEKLSAAAERIGGNAEKQAKASTESAEAVSHLIEALRSIRKGVDSQAGGIAQVSASIQVIAKEAEAVASNVEKTAEFARSLDGTAERGRAAAGTLSEAIERITETSQGISSIIDAVEDFAERTNLLAMNAAIEAAHSGAFGRGFAVIASEIKKLAAASADRASRIRESVAEIGVRIDKGVESNGRVRDALTSVAEGAKTASSGIGGIGVALASQRDATDRLRQSLSELSKAADAIRGEAERRDGDGVKAQERMTELVALSDDLRTSIAGIVTENAAIAESIRRLALVSKDGKEAALGLHELLVSRRGA
ncbi:MAG: methyl-accepting chemotaxis protein [Treponemataceae bacterium]